MIETEQEYQAAARRVQEEKSRVDTYRAQLTAEGHSDKELQRLLDPIESFHMQLQDEVENYERLKRGELNTG